MMIDELSNVSGVTVDHRARKYYEGWVQHCPLNGREWSRYWLVLRGNVLFIFRDQRTSDYRSHVGVLKLGQDTAIKSIANDKRKKHSFKFELYTTANHGQRKVNIFKFEKENDRDVWKSYIMGIATGVVPRDVQILPGQFRDVMEAVGDFQNTPPPLPSAGTPRPKLPSDLTMSPGTRSYGGGSSGSTHSSDGSGSFRSHLTTATRNGGQYPGGGGAGGGGGGGSNLQQLYNRQVDLTMKALEHSVKPKFHTGDDDDEDATMSQFSFGKPMSGGRSDGRARDDGGRHRDRGNHRRDEIGRKVNNYVDKRDHNDNYRPPRNRHDDLDIDGSLFDDGQQRFGDDESDSDDGGDGEPTLSGEPERIRPRLPAEWTSGAATSAADKRAARPNSGFPNPPPFSTLQRPAENSKPSGLPRTELPPDPLEQHHRQVDRRPSQSRDQGRMDNGGFTPAVYTAKEATWGGRKPNWTDMSSGTLRGNEPTRRGSQDDQQRKQRAYDHHVDDDDEDDYVHRFYANEDKNRYVPKWFFESITREIAESVLTLGKRHGNVLMRESATFRSAGSYVISMRRDVSGGSQIHHYEVKQSSRGYKINVDNQHGAMECLTEVMDFFLRSAGPSAKAMTNNDLESLGLSGFSTTKSKRRTERHDSSHHDDHRHHQHQGSLTTPSAPVSAPMPPPPPPAPGLPGDQQSLRLGASAFNTTPRPPPLDMQAAGGATSLRQQISRKKSSTSTTPHNSRLRATGDVDPDIVYQANKISNERQHSNPMHPDSLLDMPSHDPPPTPGSSGASGSYQGDFQGHNHSSPNRWAGGHTSGGQQETYSAKATGGIPSPPVFPIDYSNTDPTMHRSVSQTSDRINDHHLAGQMDDLYLNEGRQTSSGYFSQQNDVPVSPPPPPPPGMGAMSNDGGLNSGGGVVGGPPPPPLPGGHPSLSNPPTPGVTQPETAPFTPTPTSQQFPFNPLTMGSGAGQRKPSLQRGLSAGGPSFEDELKGRLKGQREQIYADGATILKSNWGN